MSAAPLLPRRDFVIAGLTAAGAVWVGAACAPSGDAAADVHLPAHAADTTSAPRALQHLTPAQATELEAIAARIVPSDDGTPGAREAGVIGFIDAGLGTFAADQRQLFVDGLAALDREVRRRHPRTTGFSALPAAQQDDMLRGIETTEFFGAVRFATLAGLFTLPRYGGNRGFVGWDLIGQDNAFDHQPPFGHYDRPEVQQALLGRVL